MPLVPSFSITPLASGNSFTVTDTSTGSDGTITDRQILIYTTANVLLVSPIDFPLSAGSSIIISPLTQDIAVTIVVNWLNSGGSSLYTANGIFSFVQFALLFLENLTQFQISNPNIVNDLNFMGNKYKMFTEVQSALNAISVGQNVFAAQSCILRYQNMIINTTDYF
jgi:hypothetical protein